MKNLAYTLILTLLLAVVSPTHAASRVSVTANELSRQIDSKIHEVPEFKFISEYAEHNELRVWLFGGTAATFAHYAKWDLMREKGDPRFQPNRFDYDYTNIYRASQDLDIVVDAPSEKALALQKLLASKFPHLQGTKSAWEVRPLRENMGEKEALLENPDFFNQHTDSHSVGMIELTDAREPRIRDLREWTSKAPRFLKDVVSNKLHFYFSPLHETTSRFKQGKNPPIISVVRYYIKAFQFELAIDPADEPVLRRLIEEFNPAKANSAERAWLEKNVPKLFQNAVNIEYAWNVLEQVGLRKKLLGIDSITEPGSAAWWMNKEPLRSRNIAEGLGKTARELGIKIVAHETMNFDAYESITRAHTGDPNVLISRNGSTGETAVYGDGFYTQVGREGARGTKITIRFDVDPDAREGTDFTKSGDFIVFHNKNALRVIPESLNLGFRDYVNFLTDGKIKLDERAVIEKLRRRISGRLLAEVTGADIAWFDELIKVEATKGNPSTVLFREWIALTKPLDRGMSVDQLVELLTSRGGSAIFFDTLDGLKNRNAFSRVKTYADGVELVAKFDDVEAMRKIKNALELPNATKGELRWLTEKIRASDPSKVSKALLGAWLDLKVYRTDLAKFENDALVDFMKNPVFAKMVSELLSRSYAMHGHKPLPLTYKQWLGMRRRLDFSESMGSVRFRNYPHIVFSILDGRNWTDLREALFQDSEIPSAEFIVELLSFNEVIPKADALVLFPRLLAMEPGSERDQNLKGLLWSLGNNSDSMTLKESVEFGEILLKNGWGPGSWLWNDLQQIDYFKRLVIGEGDREWLTKRVLRYRAAAGELGKELTPRQTEIVRWLKDAAAEKDLAFVLELAAGPRGAHYLEVFFRAHDGMPSWAAKDDRIWQVLRNKLPSGGLLKSAFGNAPFKNDPILNGKMIDFGKALPEGLKTFFHEVFSGDGYRAYPEVFLSALEVVHTRPLPSLAYRLTHRKHPDASKWEVLLKERDAAKSALSNYGYYNRSIRTPLKNNPIHRRFLTIKNLMMAKDAEAARFSTRPTAMTCEGAFL